MSKKPAQPDADGRWQFPFAVPDGISVYKRRGSSARSKWCIAYRVHPLDKRTIERVSADARGTLARVNRIAEMLHHGSADPREARYLSHQRRPLTDHVGDYRAYLLAKGVTNGHADQVTKRVIRVLNEAHATLIGHLAPSAILTTISAMKDGREAFVPAMGSTRFSCPICGRGHNISPKSLCPRCAKRRREGRSLAPESLTYNPAASLQTKSHYLRAVKQFSAWLAGPEKRTREDLLKHLPAWNVKTDRRHDRQDLGDEQSAKLIDAAFRAPAVLGVNGPDRAMLFETAIESGFRANELRTLTPRRCRLSELHPVLIIVASYSKHRREDHQPIRREFAIRLRDYIAGKPLDEPIWSMPSEPIDLLRGDLTRAGISYVDEDGRFADFHSLRHTYVCRLVRSGVSPKECQVLARHASITTTMDYYAHLKLHDTATAIGRMSPLPNADLSQQKMRATGTDGRTEKAQRNAQRTMVPECPPMSKIAGGVIGERNQDLSQKPADLTGKQVKTELHLRGLEPLTCGSVVTPRQNTTADLADCSGAQRTARSAGRSAPTQESLRAAIEKINSVLRLAGGSRDD